VTGLVLAATGLVALTPAVAIDDSERLASNRDLVERFYGAVNDALRTGDTAPFDALVAPDFVDLVRSPGETSSRAGLAQHLRALHTVFPVLQLTVLDLVAQDDRVLAVSASPGPRRAASSDCRSPGREFGGASMYSASRLVESPNLMVTRPGSTVGRRSPPRRFCSRAQPARPGRRGR
jgi:hypothetical protein